MSHVWKCIVTVAKNEHKQKILTTDAHHSWYLVDPSRISGARYHRVATYSVSAGFPLSSWIWLSDLAKPKSHSLTTQSVSKSTLDGCGKRTQEKQFFTRTTIVWFSCCYPEVKLRRYYVQCPAWPRYENRYYTKSEKKSNRRKKMRDEILVSRAILCSHVSRLATDKRVECVMKTEFDG